MQRAEPGVHPADGGEEAPASADGASVPCPCLTHPGDDPLREPNISNLSLLLFLVGLPYALGESASNRSAVKKHKLNHMEQHYCGTGCERANTGPKEALPASLQGSEVMPSCQRTTGCVHPKV